MTNDWEQMLALYDRLVDQCPRFERKGKKMVYTSANGHMFSALNKDAQLGFRYAEAIKKKYMDELPTTEFRSYGAVMRGYILIPDFLLKDEKRLAQLLNESYDYVMSLDPK